jgi:FAD/FMN-containing dehydrogenase
MRAKFFPVRSIHRGGPLCCLTPLFSNSRKASEANWFVEVMLSTIQHGKFGTGMIDKRPALIARCLGTADVTRCVQFAREHSLVVAVRGGGHNIAKSVQRDSKEIPLDGYPGISVSRWTRTRSQKQLASHVDDSNNLEGFHICG